MPSLEHSRVFTARQVQETRVWWRWKAPGWSNPGAHERVYAVVRSAIDH